jgi:hypothetical protein
MLITDLSHSLDPNGNIAKEMPKEARELASFLALIVDAATRDFEPPIKATDVRCRQKKCDGTIELGFSSDDDAIEWWCSDCDEAGRISGWQGSKWDTRD